VADRPFPGQPIRRPQRLGDEVYDSLYSQLMSHRIAPGTRISIDRLVRELGVSQTPIREALSRLEAQGLVVKTHLVGFSAAGQVDASRLAQMYELRLLLEPPAARWAAERMSEEALVELVELHRRMQEIDRGGPDAYGAFAALDGRFHDLIAQGCGNDLVYEALARLHVHVHLFRLFYLASATTDANAEHAGVVEALVGRCPDGAEQAMRTHVVMSRRRFIREADAPA
jgi:DNA-binding GntR family transcriptional regulator